MKKKILFSFILIICSLSTYAQIPTGNLVAEYKFDGNATDASGNGNNGTEVKGTPGNVSYGQDRYGNNGSALALTNYSHLNVPDKAGLRLGGSFTLSVWLNLTSYFDNSSYGNSVIIAKRYNLGYVCNLYGTSNGVANSNTGHVDFGGLKSKEVIPLDTWTNIIYVYDNSISTLTLYINGKKDGSVTNPTPGAHVVPFDANDSAIMQIGIDSSNANTYYPFNGEMDDLIMYSKALNASEINQLRTTITSSPGNQSIVENANASFNVSSIDPNASFQWQSNQGSGFKNVTNGSYYSGATTSRLTLTGVPYTLNSSDYRCIITSKYGNCIDTSSQAILTVTKSAGIQPLDEFSNVSLFPNPVANYLNFKGAPALSNASIYDCYGKLVCAGKNITSMNVQDLRPGLYLVKLEDITNGANCVYKVIKE